MVGQTVVVQEEELVGEYGLDAPRVVRAVGYLAGGLLALAVFFAVVGIVPLMVLAFLASVTAFFALRSLPASSSLGSSIALRGITPPGAQPLHRWM